MDMSVLKDLLNEPQFIMMLIGGVISLVVMIGFIVGAYKLNKLWKERRK